MTIFKKMSRNKSTPTDHFSLQVQAMLSVTSTSCSAHAESSSALSISWATTSGGHASFRGKNSIESMQGAWPI